MPNDVRRRDVLYFLCHLEWHKKRNVAEYQELLAALDDGDCNTRLVTEVSLRRSSPRPEAKRENYRGLVK